MANKYYKDLSVLKETPVDAGDQRLNRNENQFTETRYEDYPSMEYLRKAIAAKYNVCTGQVILGCGATGVLHTIAHALFNVNDKLITARYTYQPMVRVAKTMGVQHVLNYVTGDSVDTVHRFIVNPNNPTGEFTPPGAVISNQFKTTIVDEAYMEYHPEMPSFIDYMADIRRMVVVRSFSKYYGLAGLRVGYGIATSDIAAEIRKAEMPYCVNQSGYLAAIEVMNAEDEFRKAADVSTFSLHELHKGLNELGVQTLLPAGNFIAAKVPDIKGFATRDLTGYANMSGWRRINSAPVGVVNDYLFKLKEHLIKTGRL